MYITQTDIENCFGATNVAQWSSYNNTTNPPVNLSRIAVAINYAEAFVNARMSMSPYAIPVQASDGSIPPEITDMCATLAGIWLWNSRALKQSSSNQQFMLMRKKDAHTMLMAIIAGSYPLNAVHRGQQTTTPVLGGRSY